MGDEDGRRIWQHVVGHVALDMVKEDAATTADSGATAAERIVGEAKTRGGHELGHLVEAAGKPVLAALGSYRWRGCRSRAQRYR